VKKVSHLLTSDVLSELTVSAEDVLWNCVIQRSQAPGGSNTCTAECCINNDRSVQRSHGQVCVCTG